MICKNHIPVVPNRFQGSDTDKATQVGSAYLAIEENDNDTIKHLAKSSATFKVIF